MSEVFGHVIWHPSLTLSARNVCVVKNVVGLFFRGPHLHELSNCLQMFFLTTAVPKPKHTNTPVKKKLGKNDLFRTTH